jgi:hypothetical protein
MANVSGTIPLDLKARVEALARLENRSFSAELIRALTAHVAAHDLLLRYVDIKAPVQGDQERDAA